ncbi:MAG: outer membrane protein assembly factor BamD [Gammaproteobacteria bacterium]
MRLIYLLFLFIGIALTACKTTEPYHAYKGLSDQAIFQRGEQHLKKKHYEAAVADFEALDVLYPFGPYTQQAQLDIIYAYYKKGDTDSALAAVDRYIRLYPAGSGVDYAYYMKGLINMGPPDTWMDHWARSEASQRDTSNIEQAYQDFDLLIQRYPNSAYAPSAAQHRLQARDLLAQHQLNIAEYYLRYRAYVAAVNRSVELVRQYPGSAQAASALKIMVISYHALGEHDLANQTQQQLDSIHHG